MLWKNAGRSSPDFPVRHDVDKLQRSLRLRSGQALRVAVRAVREHAGLRMTNLKGNVGPSAAEAAFLGDALRGAEAPLFHGGAGVRACTMPDQDQDQRQRT